MAFYICPSQTEATKQKLQRIPRSLESLEFKHLNLLHLSFEESLKKKAKILNENSRSLVVKVCLPSGISFVVKRISKQNNSQRIIHEKIVNSRRILKYFGYLEDQKHTLMVTELCSGGDLRNKLNKQGALKQTKAKKYLQQIIQGLKQLHEKNIIHRDIKGSNVFIKGKNVVLGDFQCSEIYSRSNIEFKGSILWMSPQTMRQEVLSTKTDIWSLGCLMIQMISGKLPWSQKCFDNEFAAMFQISSGVSKPEIPDGVSENLKQIIQDCLSLQCDKRPSCSQLLLHKYFN